MTFKNIVFEIDDKRLEDIIRYRRDPEGNSGFIDKMRVDEKQMAENYKIPIVNMDVKNNGTDKSYRIKFSVDSVDNALNQAAYDNLILQLLYDDTEFHNVKFYIPKKEIENIIKFLFSKENQMNGEDIFYLKHSTKNPESKGKNDEYTAKIAANRTPNHEEVLRLTNFLRQYL